MGMLDEAIREHLELKRLRGADPGEVAKAERDALDPVVPNEPATWGQEAPVLDAEEAAALAAEAAGHVAPAGGADAYTGETAVAGAPVGEGLVREPSAPGAAYADGGGLAGAEPTGETPDLPSPGGRDRDFANVGQETAEIDMEAYLAADEDGSGAGPAGARSSGESFEWEMPAGGRTASGQGAEGEDVEALEELEVETGPDPIPGQERLTFE
jgi:hypothetical protein